ncbi:ATP-binding protein [Limosilactobacillus oris]|uniref:ATP-binding protein n=1 Tax=Limosilactobacillus oris TaxID=1632 RepID=UPI002235F25E|nr:ATP-binding protein [Limosilactobacillus oris]MCW4387099.1 ATP-binding protein [Limosilactobacillus oris]
MSVVGLLGLSETARRKFFEAHGVDIKHAETHQEERNRTWHQMITDQLFAKKMRYFDHISLWSGDERLAFTFNDWDVNKQSNQLQAKVVGNRCFQLAKELTVDNFNVALLGKPGVGKTSLALAMLDAAHGKHKTTMFVSTMAFMLLLDKQTRAKDYLLSSRIDEIIAAMKRVDVLLLDDFGTEGGMKRDIRPVRKDMQDRIFAIADARLATIKDEDGNKRRTKSTIITTNNTPQQLLEMYNEKVISRLLPHDEERLVQFDGLEDVR